MISPTLLQTLIACAETGSFELASARLGVTPSAVSQRIRALTEAAGGPVFSHLQPATPSPLGQRLLRHARDISALEADLAADLGQDGGPRPISIAVNADSLESWAVAPLASCEGFRFDIVIIDQDHTADALRRGHVSAAVTSEAAPLPGCQVWPLGALRYAACCTPAFRDRYFAEGVTPETLATAPLMEFTALDGLQSRWIERATGADLHPAPHRLPAPGPFLQATREGMGWGLNPLVMIEGDLRQGRLVELLPDSRLDTPLYWQVSRVMAEALAPITRALRQAGREALIPLDSQA